jgi:hypothetical protein
LLERQHLVKVGEFQASAVKVAVLYSLLPTGQFDVSEEVNRQVAAAGGEAIVNFTVQATEACAVLNSFLLLTAIPLWPGCVPLTATGDIVKRVPSRSPPLFSTAKGPGLDAVAASRAAQAALPAQLSPSAFAWLFAAERTLHFQIDGDREVNGAIGAFGLLDDENACSTTDGTERCRYPSTEDGVILRSQGRHLVISLEPQNVRAVLALLQAKVGKTLRVEITGNAEIYSTIGAFGLLDNEDACQMASGVEMCNYPPTKEGYVLKSKNDHLEISLAF